MRIGIDLGGTKIEILAIDDRGTGLHRARVPTPTGDYAATVAAVAGLVRDAEQRFGPAASIGVGTPGAISRASGRIKNANSVCLNGQPLREDLQAALGRAVVLANDANCFALSEATDGAAAGAGLVFAVILGTGCGGGIAVHGEVRVGPNGVSGEWGHNPLPWATADEFPGPLCFCGQRGCLETWISGTGLARDHERVTGNKLSGPEIVAAAAGGDAAAEASIVRLEDRAGRALASVVNLLDPDVIVIGGGLSRLDRLYAHLPALIARHLFGGGELATPVLKAKHGDASGVRGAAWLWPA